MLKKLRIKSDKNLHYIFVNKNKVKSQESVILKNCLLIFDFDEKGAIIGIEIVEYQ